MNDADRPSAAPASAWGRSNRVAGDNGDADIGSAALERTFDGVKQTLAREPEISWWSATLRVVRSDQLYMVREEVEAERGGVSHSIDVALHTRNGSEVGQATFSLGSGEESRLEDLLRRAIGVAKQAGVPAYVPPEPTLLPEVKTIDREIAEHPSRALQLLRGQLADSMARRRDARVASAEFFVFYDRSRMETSHGLVADLSGTRATAEVVLLGQGRNGREAEVQDLRYRRTVRDLELESWVSALGEEASDAAGAEGMATWKGPVVLRADVLDAYFGPLVQRLSGDTVYRGMSPYELGDWVCPAEPVGDTLTLFADRTLPYALATAPCDEEGVAGTRDVLVEDGQVRRFWANARFAQYLGIEPTGNWSNLVIEPGTRSGAELLSGDEVLEVVRFSWFTPSRATGDFATEMRLGYLHRGGQKVPVKGGAVTGNAFDALQAAYFSRETQFVARGLVPRYLRLEGLDVTGA